MDDLDSTYAPQSPDLSAYHSSYTAPEQQKPSSYYPQHQQLPYQPQAYLQHHQQQQHSPFDSQHFVNHIPQQPSYQQSPTAMPVKNGRTKSEHEDGDWALEAGSSTGKGRKSKKVKLEQEDYGAGGKLAPGVEEGIEVKTKFPVARIKRIMQADEDVGKVAQVTPTAVSKALELFMISVVTKAANEAKSKSSKRVTAAHLKAAVQKDEQLDFLAEIISKVPDAPAPKAAKEEVDSEEGGVDVGKKKKGGRRKKREGEE